MTGFWIGCIVGSVLTLAAVKLLPRLFAKAEQKIDQL